MDIFTIAIVILVSILTITFIFYKKITFITFSFINLIFPILIVIALSTVFLPSIYKSLGESIVSNSPFGEQIKNVDTILTQAGETQNSIVGQIQNLFGQGNSNQEKYESDLFEKFAEFIGNTLRMFTLLLALILSVVVVYIKYAYSGVYEVERLKKRVEVLEIKE